MARLLLFILLLFCIAPTTAPMLAGANYASRYAGHDGPTSSLPRTRCGVRIVRASVEIGVGISAVLEAAYDERLPSKTGPACRYAVVPAPRSISYRLAHASLDGQRLELVFSDRSSSEERVRFHGWVDGVRIVGQYHFDTPAGVYVPLTLVQEVAPAPPDGTTTPCPTASPK